jgi:Raf kinase inhibitor-like YbhB/YbcL family protein
MQLRAAFIVSVAALVPLATACNHDGRTLRPARPDQVGSVSTLAPVTEPTDGISNAVLSTGPSESSPAVSPTGEPGATDVALYASFADGATIDARNTCQGANVSPTLTWSPAPAQTVEIAVTMEDLDAPDFVHWAIAGLDPLSIALGEGVVPEFAITGLNGTGTPGYTGPCPPTGETHTYRITVYYLGQQTELPTGSPGADLIASIEGAALASASITGTYSQS